LSYAAGSPANARALRQRWLGNLHPVLTREILVPMAFVLAILATNYSLTAVPNVKLFDLMVFVAGYTLGVRRGATVAVVAWLVYGNFNPWGTSTGSLLMTVMAMETVYALAGASVRRLLPPDRVRLGPGWATVAFALAALAATVAYDVTTNIYTGVSWARIASSADVAQWVWTALLNPGALFFFFMHAGSNVALFAALGPGMVRGVEWGKEAMP
jgi:hypothetical protein